MKRESQMARAKSAFTIIELLVVVTIIVLLLALISPALSKAIYSSQLTKCGAGPLRTMAAGVIQYAMENKRFYPDRGIQNLDRRGTVTYLPAMALAYPLQGGFDARPPLRPLFSINKMVQCPFVEPVEMDHTEPDINVEASYMMLWGWQYKPAAAGNSPGLPGGGAAQTGMFKLGDRFEWREGNRNSFYRVLAADMDLIYAEAGSIQGSHPDRDQPSMWQLVAVEAPGFWPRNNLSRWVNNMRDRGLADLNFVYDDGSVLRLDGLLGWQWNRRDPRLDRLPLQYDVVRRSDEFHLPKQ